MAHEENEEAFIRLMSSCQKRLFLYLRGLLSSRDLAEETLQDTNVILWRKRAAYEPGTNFVAWACQIAFFRGLRRGGTNVATRRSSATYFSPISRRTCWPPPRRRTRWRSDWKTASRSSNVSDRELLERRYTPGSNTRAVAAGMGCSIDAVYRALRRIHGRLFDCITGKLREEAPIAMTSGHDSRAIPGFVLVAPGRLCLGRGCGTF